jgi:hypothetical protein
MAQLGRDAVKTIADVRGIPREPIYFVNKTEKYVSIKIECDHLTDTQMATATTKLKRMHPDRFLKITNGTSTGRWSRGEKVMVRFTQDTSKCPCCGH